LGVSDSEVKLANRLIRWITFDIVFALIPFIIIVVLRALMGSLSAEKLSDSPEILFFAIMVCGTATGDLYGIADPLGWDNLLKVLFSLMLLGAVFSAILYGSFLYNTIIGPDSPLFKENLFHVSIYMTSSLAILAFLTEFLIARVEEAS